jgi:hypothetical protein
MCLSPGGPGARFLGAFLPSSCTRKLAQCSSSVAQAEGDEAKLAGATLLGVATGWYLGTSGSSVMTDKSLTDTIASIQKSHPDNIAMACFDINYYNSLVSGLVVPQMAYEFYRGDATRARSFRSA